MKLKCRRLGSGSGMSDRRDRPARHFLKAHGPVGGGPARPRSDNPGPHPAFLQELAIHSLEWRREAQACPCREGGACPPRGHHDSIPKLQAQGVWRTHSRRLPGRARVRPALVLGGGVSPRVVGVPWPADSDRLSGQGDFLTACSLKSRTRQRAQ